MEVIHNSPKGGHSGISASVKRAEVIFYWPNLRNDVTELVKQCDICQRNKFEHVLTPGLLQPIHIPNQAEKSSLWTLWKACLNQKVRIQYW